VLGASAGQLPSAPIDVIHLAIPKARLTWPGWSRPLVLSMAGLRVEVLQKQAPLVSEQPGQQELPRRQHVVRLLLQCSCNIQCIRIMV